MASFSAAAVCSRCRRGRRPAAFSPRAIEGADDGADDAGVFRITMAIVGGISVARFAEDEADDAIGIFAEAGDFQRVVRAIGTRGGGVKIRVATVRRLG